MSADGCSGNQQAIDSRKGGCGFSRISFIHVTYFCHGAAELTKQRVWDTLHSQFYRQWKGTPMDVYSEQYN